MGLHRAVISEAKVRDNFEARVSFEPEEKLVLLLDTSIWSNGKSGIAVTNRRVLEYGDTVKKTFVLETIEGVKVYKDSSWHVWLGLANEEDQVLSVVDPAGHCTELESAIEGLLPGGKSSRQPSEEQIAKKAPAEGAGGNLLDSWGGVVGNGVMAGLLPGLGGSLIQAEHNVIGWILLVIGAVAFLSAMGYNGKQAWLKRMVTGALLVILGGTSFAVGSAIWGP